MSRCNGKTLQGKRCKNTLNCHIHTHFTFRMGSDMFPNLNRYFNDRVFMNRWVNAFENTMETEEDVFITFHRLTGEDTSNFTPEMKIRFLQRFFDYKYGH
jgi:hypothetical protein